MAMSFGSSPRLSDHDERTFGGLANAEEKAYGDRVGAYERTMAYAAGKNQELDSARISQRERFAHEKEMAKMQSRGQKKQGGGIGGILGGIGGQLLGSIAGPIGSSIGGAIGKNIFGG